MKYNDNGVWKDLNVKVTDTLPVGTIMPFAGESIPANYMKCEGQALSRTEYALLFSAIGTTYGEGDGSTTFNIPNLKGRVITGADANDTDFDSLGETGGEKTHTLTIDEMPSHDHSFTFDQTAGSNVDAVHVGGQSGWERNTTSTGGGQAHNIMQPYMVLNYIIKVLDAPATGTRSETLPVGSEIDYDGNNIPAGWEEIDETPIIYKEIEENTNIDNLKDSGIYGIFNATGTLPSGYSTSDNNFMIEVLFWYEDYGRQIAHDVRTTRTFIRNMNNGNWQSWREFQIN